MDFIDANFKRYPGKYFWQCSLAIAMFVLVLLFLDVLEHTAIIATLGATAFIAFAMPRSYSSKPRHLIGGYAVGIAVGCLCSYLAVGLADCGALSAGNANVVVSGAIAVGAAIFLMAILNMEHPPAAGMALSLVINPWELETMLFIVGSVLLFALVKELLKRFMIDLANTAITDEQRQEKKDVPVDSND